MHNRDSYRSFKVITCRNLITDAIEPAVDSIIAYRGDPDQRTSMEFEVRFSDGTVV